MRSPVSSIHLATSLLPATVAATARAEDLYVPNQFATIQAAMAQARIDGLSPEGRSSSGVWRR
jgi:hypothetical protein